MPLYGQSSGSPRGFMHYVFFIMGKSDSTRPRPALFIRHVCNARPRPNGFNTTTRKDAKDCSSKCRLRAFRNEGEGAP